MKTLTITLKMVSNIKTPVEEIINNETEDVIKMLVNETYEISYSVLPSNHTDELVWSSTNQSVATVEDGVITAVGFGETVITLTANENVSYSWNIEVQEVKVTSLTLNKNEFEIFAYESFEFTYEFNEGAIGNVIWTLSEGAVSTIDQNGVFKAGDADEVVTVTATLEGNNEIKASCVVTVEYVECTELLISNSEITLNPGMSTKITSTTNENCHDKINYSSSNKYITVDEYGNVRALRANLKGVITITCGNYEQQCDVSVTSGETLKNVSYSDINVEENVEGSIVVVNGFEVYLHTKKTDTSQVRDIYFYAKTAGTIKFTYYETGSNKNRMAKLYDAFGNIVKKGVGGTEKSSTQLTLEAKINPGVYYFSNFEELGEGASNLMNLKSISFTEANEQLYYQYDNDSAPTAVRFIGTIEVADVTTINTITLSFKLDGNDANKTVNITKLYTSVADTYEAVEGTYYVCYAITGIGSALNHEFEVTMTVEYADTTVASVTRSFTLGINA